MTSTTTERPHHDPHSQPPHPGELLRELWLEPLALSIKAAAEQMKVSRKTLSAIVNARGSVWPDMALRHQAVYDPLQIDARRKDLGIRRMETPPVR